jgi:hypothetical protein
MEHSEQSMAYIYIYKIKKINKKIKKIKHRHTKKQTNKQTKENPAH